MAFSREVVIIYLSVFKAMTEKLNGNILRVVITVLLSLVVSLGGYYVHQNDKRWDEYIQRQKEVERWNLDLQTRLARIEERQVSIFKLLDKKF